MKLFRETHDEDADFAVIQYGGGTICTVEPTEITEEEIQQLFLDNSLYNVTDKARFMTFGLFKKAILSKLKGDE